MSQEEVTINRFYPQRGACMESHPDGGYVRFSEVEELTSKVLDLEHECREAVESEVGAVDRANRVGARMAEMRRALEEIQGEAHNWQLSEGNALVDAPSLLKHLGKVAQKALTRDGVSCVDEGPVHVQQKREEAKEARLNEVGRTHFELEEYVSRCRLQRRAPTLRELEELLRVVEPATLKGAA